MTVYSASIAMINQLKAVINESSFSTDIWEFENQPNAAHSIGSHGIWTIILRLVDERTHGDLELSLDYGDDEIRRAQNKTSNERVEKYAFPFICSLELDSPV